MEQTGIVYDERYLEHITGQGAMEYPPERGLAHQMPHPEAPERIKNVHSLITSSRFIDSLIQISPKIADPSVLELVHEKSYIDTVRELSESGGGRIEPTTPLSGRSYEIALLAVGGCITGAEAILRGEVENVYALIRPPGHHASRAQGMGFCLFNNVAITAEYLKQEHGLERVLIVDWDVHHGNGTQSIFYEDPSVMFFSLHQDGNYPPQSGTIEEVGKGKGEGFTINIPLPPGTGDWGYVSAFREVVEPLCRQFRPEFILVSAGQDPSMVDPLGRMCVTYEGFEKMASIVKRLAQECCLGRLLIAQEGGYNIVYQPYAVVTMIEALSGQKADLNKPYSEFKYPETAYFKDNLQKVLSTQRRYWDL
jgi:acetoin utilization deacetylase AcuC-like enzyme